MTAPAARRGRPPAASAADVARLGLQLFLREGYGRATMADVAAAAGIGRSTLFRYFPTKASLVWLGAREVGEAVAAALAGAPADRPWRRALVDALVSALVFPGDDLEALRWRLRLITSDPGLRASLAEAVEPGADVVAAFVAGRTGARADDLLPRTTARAALATSTTALTWWAEQPAGGAAPPDPRAAVRQALEAVLLPDRRPTPPARDAAIDPLDTMR